MAIINSINYDYYKKGGARHAIEITTHDCNLYRYPRHVDWGSALVSGECLCSGLNKYSGLIMIIVIIVTVVVTNRMIQPPHQLVTVDLPAGVLVLGYGYSWWHRRKQNQSKQVTQHNRSK
ncbi:uncharacterized protein SN13T_2124 [Lactiplantibacillus plantarum]|nr:uncharacterized protein SN13T_2124 [Lactiplantibacillus plantarum]